MDKLSKNYLAQVILPYFLLLAMVLFVQSSGQGFVTILMGCVFLSVAILSSVHHAEEIALQIGEGLGMLVLALSVTVIEVGLIVSIMSNGGSGASSLARDTVVATIIIVCNGVVGICLLLGGLKYNEIGFRFEGASSLLVILITLSVISFILPNYTTSVDGSYYSHTQLLLVSGFSLLLYVVLIVFQTKTHREYFTVSDEEVLESKGFSTKKLILSCLSLFVGLVTVIGFAKFLAPSIEAGVEYVGAPKAVVGLIISSIVLFPETIAAIFAAKQNRLQSSINLALGSGAASIALTIPVMSAFSFFKDQPLILGVDDKNMVFLCLTFLISTITLGSGKATALQGVVHLILLHLYFAMTIFP